MNDTPQDNEMSLLVAFVDQSASFVHGYEAGAIAETMKNQTEMRIDRGFKHGFPVHTGNLEVLTRIAKAYGYSVETKETDYPEWTAALFVYGIKPRLSVVRATTLSDLIAGDADLIDGGK